MIIEWLALFLAVLCSAFFKSADGANIRSVNTPFGILNGETIEVARELPSVTQYLGVPYGVSPTGQYRFNMAISAAKWTHQAKDATKSAPVCIQSGFQHMSETEALKKTSAHRFDFNHRVLPYLKPQSEDCLYMNIYVPNGLANTEAKLSVLLVVHGSEYGWGSSNAINGSMLAASGQVVVVTVNYRLDVYGFLSKCEANSCTGNAGLTDLVAALKMLSNTLPSFGADPQAITMLGWGSGAALISLLMASPITQPKNRLFKRAILLDGSALCPWALSDYPQQYFMRLANELKCSPQPEKEKYDWFDKDLAQTLRCVQEHSQQNVTAAAQKIKAPTFTSAFAPIVDGQVVPNHPKFSFSPKFGALFRDIDLMVGTVTHPAHHYLANSDLIEGVSTEKRDKLLRTLVRNLFDYHRSEVYDAILNEYTNWDEPRNHSRVTRDMLLHLLADVLYVSPLVETLRAHSTDEAPKVASTFFFLFNHEIKNDAGETGIRGSLPEDHVAYIFGYPLFENTKDKIFTGFSDKDKDVSRVMMTYISNFIKSGDVARPKPLSTQTTIEDRFHSMPWPQYNQATREAYLEISDRPKIRNFYRNSFVGFWNSYIPRLNRGSKQHDRQVDEEHHFLPDHFNRQTFYGVVRPYSNYHNDPFPPPPLPPTPLPKDLKKLTTTPKPSPPPLKSTEGPQTRESGINYNQTLVAIVIIGIFFVVINLCIYVGIVKACNNKGNRNSKKQLKYQSYTTNNGGPNEVTYIPNSPFGQQLLPPSTALTSELPPLPSRNQSRDETSRASSLAYESSATSMRHHLVSSNYHNGVMSNSQHKLSLQEQEPLLAGSSKSSTPGLVRPGISPTCPRHGRAAQMMVSQSRANSVGSSMVMAPHNTVSTPANNNNVTGLEEVQV